VNWRRFVLTLTRCLLRYSINTSELGTGGKKYPSLTRLDLGQVRVLPMNKKSSSYPYPSLLDELYITEPCHPCSMNETKQMLLRLEWWSTRKIAKLVARWSTSWGPVGFGKRIEPCQVIAQAFAKGGRGGGGHRSRREGSAREVREVFLSSHNFQEM
jgi:hypothetical protein